MRSSLIIILILFTIQSCSKLKNDEQLELKIKEVVLSGKDELILKDLTNFEWDNLLILTPYSSIATFEEKLKINLTKVQDVGIESRDDITQLIFVLDKKPVRTITYPRYPGDFVEREIKLIPKDKAVFKIIVTQQVNSNGDKWIKLERK